MKKSQLKHIIRESIRELMNEQPGPFYCNPGTGPAYNCTNSPTGASNESGPYQTIADCEAVCNPIISGFVYQDGNCLDCSTGNYQQYCLAVNAVVYPNNPSCMANTPGAGLNCSVGDFKWTGTCSVQHLHPSPGNQSTYDNWLSQRWTGYQSVGCQHLNSAQNWLTNQVNSGNFTGTTLQRKLAKLDWTGCMLSHCQC